MARVKSWTEKLAAGKPPHVATLEKPFAGLPPGARLLIPSPALLQAAVEAVPPGATMAVAALRSQLAERHGADAACPVSTAIFLRIVAEAALEAMAAGAPAEAVAPFWRVVDPASPLAKKLSCGPGFIERERAREAGGGPPG